MATVTKKKRKYRKTNKVRKNSAQGKHDARTAQVKGERMWMVCRKCASLDIEVLEVRGNGKIRTFATVYVGAEGRQGECPYTIVLVELDDGPWIMGNLIDIDPSQVTMELIGRRVKMGHKVFPGDKYSGGDAARPLFSFET